MPYPLTEDDFEPDTMYLDMYPRIVLWKNMEPVVQGDLTFLATIIDRQDSPNDYRYYVPSVQVSEARTGGTISNQLAEDLQSSYYMDEAIETINQAIIDIYNKHEAGEYEMPFIDDFDPNEDFEDWSTITGPADY